jgi:hypothetical protein
VGNACKSAIGGGDGCLDDKGDDGYEGIDGGDCLTVAMIRVVVTVVIVVMVVVSMVIIVVVVDIALMMIVVSS